MPKICYVDKNFAAGTLELIQKADDIIEEYAAQGYNLTLRQLYYQFVARDIIQNKQSEYKRLGKIISDARRAGLLDWDAIVDRTRELKSLSHWSSPREIIRACANQYRIDKWSKQPYRVEVWIEKDALAGVFQRVCEENDVPYFSCRGYTSDSEIWGAACRLARYHENGQTPLVLHFGDHDPSGLDMTRDIQERLELFSGVRFQVDRLALNMDQVENYNPPPNPAKETDSRFAGYIASFGDESWELDALEPEVLARLVTEAVENVREESEWEMAVGEENEAQRIMGEAATHWSKVVKMLNRNGDNAE